DEVDARVERRADQALDLLDAERADGLPEALAPERHRPEADLRDVQPRLAEQVVAHGLSLSLESESDKKGPYGPKSRVRRLSRTGESGPERGQRPLVERAAAPHHAAGAVEHERRRQPLLPERVRELQLLVEED